MPPSGALLVQLLKDFGLFEPNMAYHPPLKKDKNTRDTQNIQKSEIKHTTKKSVVRGKNLLISKTTII